MEVVETLTNAQFQTVYNILSLALASMAATTVFLLAVTPRVLPRYRLALVVSAMVCFIAAYHYMRIFDSFSDAYVAVGVGTPGVAEVFELVKGDGFNEGYRYVDWLLTVPLLLFETVAVLALPAAVRRSLLWKLIPASALMIILGYPGEVTADMTGKAIWGALSTIPFIYILYVLFVELSRAAKSQPNQVGKELAGLRWLLLATWGVYPISYAFPMLARSHFPKRRHAQPGSICQRHRARLTEASVTAAQLQLQVKSGVDLATECWKHGHLCRAKPGDQLGSQ